jgi:hypothetical protein
LAAVKNGKAPAKSVDNRRRMQVWVDRKVQARFKALVRLLDCTIEERVEHLMRQDIKANNEVFHSESA